MFKCFSIRERDGGFIKARIPTSSKETLGGTDARSSPTFSNYGREGEEDRRGGWRKPVSPGGRFGVSGRGDFLGNGEREDSRKTSYERQRQKDASRVEKG